MIEFIFFSLTILLFVSIVALGYNMSRPSVLYIFGFWMCTFVAFLLKNEWGLWHLSPLTAYFFVFGAFLFFAVEWLYFKRFPIPQSRLRCTLPPQSDDIAIWKLNAFIIFQLFAFYLMADAKINYAGGVSLTDALVQINDEQKFEEKLFKLPFYINTPYNICMVAGYMWTILLPYYQLIRTNSKIVRNLIAVNFLVLLVGCLLSGGRMGIMFFIICYISFFYICYKFKKRWVTTVIPVKFVKYGFTLLLIFVFSFQTLGRYIGRDTTKTSVSIILPMYCGAQLKNLDDYLSHPFKHGNESHLVAQYTFAGFYNKLSQRLGSTNSREYSVTLPFNNYRGIPLGNVYSIYYYYYSDYKEYGILFTCLMSIICAFLYRKTILSDFWRNGHLNYWMLLYANFIGAIFVSFFANQFFGNVAFSWLIRNFLYWYILVFFFQGRSLLNKKTLYT